MQQRSRRVSVQQKKRVQQAVDSYKEVVNDFSKTQEARSTVFSILGDPTAIHFYETENALALKQSQPDQALPEPFAKYLHEDMCLL